jgi:hypothetical protein
VHELCARAPSNRELKRWRWLARSRQPSQQNETAAAGTLCLAMLLLVCWCGVCVCVLLNLQAAHADSPGCLCETAATGTSALCLTGAAACVCVRVGTPLLPSCVLARLWVRVGVRLCFMWCWPIRSRRQTHGIQASSSRGRPRFWSKHDFHWSLARAINLNLFPNL